MCNTTGKLEDDTECYLCEGTGENCFRPFPPGSTNYVRVPVKWVKKPVEDWEEFINNDIAKLANKIEEIKLN